jgi:uncharacterized membrane protein (DUF485 family)
MFGMFDFVAHADDLLLRAWTAKPRDWGTLVRFCFMVAIALGILCFVIGFVLVFIASIKAPMGTKLSEAFFFGWSFAALVALFALILTLPAMLLKQISGDFKPPADANRA